MAVAWNWWFHITAHTYGSWLRGDPRGWRERHHRRHVEGDYKRRPAPGTGEDELALSKALMDREAVKLTLQLRWVALIAVVTTLLNDGIEVLVASLDGHHLHVLARVRGGDTRRRMGWSKFHATKKVKEAMEILKARGVAAGLELALGDGIWVKGSRAEPVADRAHQLRVVPYVSTTAAAARSSTCTPTPSATYAGSTGSRSRRLQLVDERIRLVDARVHLLN